MRLDELVDKRRRRVWIALTSKAGTQETSKTRVRGKASGQTPRGEVELVLRWSYEPALEHFEDDLEEEEGLAKRGGEPNELCVALVQARGLLPMDKASVLHATATTSDPLARVRVLGSNGHELKDCRGQTHHVLKTLAPWWNVQLRLPVSKLEALQGAKLEVVVEDWDRFSKNDFIGCATVPLAQLASGCKQRAWHSLGTKSQQLAAAPGAPVKKKTGILTRCKALPRDQDTFFSLSLKGRHTPRETPFVTLLPKHVTHTKSILEIFIFLSPNKSIERSSQLDDRDQARLGRGERARLGGARSKNGAQLGAGPLRPGQRCHVPGEICERSSRRAHERARPPGGGPPLFRGALLRPVRHYELRVANARVTRGQKLARARVEL